MDEQVERAARHLAKTQDAFANAKRDLADVVRVALKEKRITRTEAQALKPTSGR